MLSVRIAPAIWAIVMAVGVAGHDDDSLFQRLTRRLEELHKHLTPSVFEPSCTRYSISHGFHT